MKARANTSPVAAAPAKRGAPLAAMQTIAQFTVLEALRSRVLWLMLAVLAVGAGLSGFLSAVALTETRETQVALLAALLRLSAVFMLTGFVVTSMAREAQEKGTELILALPVPRTAWLLGKLAGFGAVAGLPAVLFGGLLAFFAAPGQTALWAASLLCELWIVAAFAVFCSVTMSRPVAALSAVAGFYLLARSIAALQLLAHGNAVIGTIALLLPRLDQFAQAEWLLYGTGDSLALAYIAIQTAIYLALLTAAAAFDLHRKDF